jgi:type I restriction enzyme S subunit
VSYFNKTVASKDMSGYYLLKNGEFAYNKSYSIGYDFGSIKRLDRYSMGALSTLYICFSLKKHNSDFMKAYFDSLKWYREIYMISAEGARNHGLLNVPTDDFFDTKHYLPQNEDEQRKIADFLIALEHRIEAQQSLVDNLKKYKRGAFEVVFSRKLRLVPANKHQKWKKYKLSDFATRITRKNGTNTDIPLTISAQYGLIDQRDFFSKTVASTDMSGYYLLKSGEFAYNRSTSNEYPFGSIKHLESYQMGAVSTLYLCFAINEDVVISDLAKWYFESSQWHRGINEICAEGARNHGLLNVPTDGFFNTVHLLPSDRSEQIAIAKYLSLLQAKYDKSLIELEQLNTIRRALLQQLFI